MKADLWVQEREREEKEKRDVGYQFENERSESQI